MYLNYFSISRKRHVEIEGHVSFFTKENTKENFYIWSRYCWEIFSSLSKIEQTKGDGELSVFRSDLSVSPSVYLFDCCWIPDWTSCFGEISCQREMFACGHRECIATPFFGVVAFSTSNIRCNSYIDTYTLTSIHIH